MALYSVGHIVKSLRDNAESSCWSAGHISASPTQPNESGSSIILTPETVTEELAEPASMTPLHQMKMAAAALNPAAPTLECVKNTSGPLHSSLTAVPPAAAPNVTAITKLEDENSALRQRTTQVETPQETLSAPQLRAALASCQKQAETDSDAHKANIASLNADVHNLKTVSKNLTEQLASQNESIEQLKADNAALRDSLSRLKLSHDAKFDTIDENAKLQRSSTAAQQGHLKALDGQLRANFHRLNNNTSTTTDRVAALESSLVLLKDETADLRDAYVPIKRGCNEGVTDRLDPIHSKLSALPSQLEESLDMAHHGFDEIRNRLESLDRNITKLEISGCQRDSLNGVPEAETRSHVSKDPSFSMLGSGVNARIDCVQGKTVDNEDSIHQLSKSFEELHANITAPHASSSHKLSTPEDFQSLLEQRCPRFDSLPILGETESNDRFVPDDCELVLLDPSGYHLADDSKQQLPAIIETLSRAVKKVEGGKPIEDLEDGTSQVLEQDIRIDSLVSSTADLLAKMTAFRKQLNTSDQVGHAKADTGDAPQAAKIAAAVKACETQTENTRSIERQNNASEWESCDTDTSGGPDASDTPQARVGVRMGLEEGEGILDAWGDDWKPWSGGMLDDPWEYQSASEDNE